MLQRFAHAVHVQYAQQVNHFYGALKALSKCTNVPGLVPLAYNFTNSEAPTQIKYPTSGKCSMHPSATANKKSVSAHGENLPTEFRWECVNYFGLWPRPIDFCRSSRGGTCHVPRGTNRPTIGTIIFLPFRCVDWCLSRPDPTTHSCTRCKNA